MRQNAKMQQSTTETIAAMPRTPSRSQKGSGQTTWVLSNWSPGKRQVCGSREIVTPMRQSTGSSRQPSVPCIIMSSAKFGKKTWPVTSLKNAVNLALNMVAPRNGSTVFCNSRAEAAVSGHLMVQSQMTCCAGCRAALASSNRRTAGAEPSPGCINGSHWSQPVTLKLTTSPAV
eukprot:CAMPEP_0117577144 /NCGR_PEP_ID=MMETSP0784-20121206/63239_1 /TAXON_ID=39447 /ORGANISM="" /LENGTH=173 /DNA_ID=CAMNT_0005376573 /DNA_START=162 /DNA_END=683 /DNA_ORIENTATION=+